MEFETIIVGAGPAGLQFGYFLEKGGHPYCILERADCAASSFENYPHSGKLHSINKKNTGSVADAYDFNLRHDWNSLLNDEKMSFTSYTDEYYPNKDDLVRYMNDFAGRFKLNIKYKHTVKQIFKEDAAGAAGGYRLEVEVAGAEKPQIFKCSKLVMASGLSKPVLPPFSETTKVTPKHYADYPKDFFLKPENLRAFQNKSVLIIGNGNAGYELANLLTPHASHVLVYGRRPTAWAAVTHYPGDLRSANLPFLDTFLLNGQQASEWDDNDKMWYFDQISEKDPYTISYLCSTGCKIKHKFDFKGEFDHVIFATGWEMDTSVFKFKVPTVIADKYPALDEEFQSVENRNLYFIGALMHSNDYRRSTGGFIHGFRYLIEYFYNVHYKKHLDIDLFKGESVAPVIDHIMYKINRTSPLYQLYSYMTDCFYFDPAKKEFVYFNSVPASSLKKILSVAGKNLLFQLTLGYGEKRAEKIYELGAQPSKNPALANLLHPIVKVFRLKKNSTLAKEALTSIELVEVVHFAENLFTDFTEKDEYYNKFLRLVKGYI